MAYATNLEFAEGSGLGVRVVDENVGTGDGAEDSFDLDNDNVVAGSFVISHAASGSNDFSALTNTTDYTLDLESGRILLTASGIAAVGTDIIYATYFYLDQFNNDQITSMLDLASSEVNLVTGKDWDTPTDQIEHFNGWRRYGYPQTEGPYDQAFSWNDRIVVSKFPVVDVMNVYYLDPAQKLGKVFNEVSFGADVDITTAVSSLVEDPATLFRASPLSGDAVYFGASNRFFGMDLSLATLGVGTPTIVWSYWNGTTWTQFTPQQNLNDVRDFKQSGVLQWFFLPGWTEVEQDGFNGYFIRAVYATSTGTFTTVPVLSVVHTADLVSQVLEPYQYKWERNGVVYLQDETLLSGDQNIRVDYNLGQDAVPNYINELTVLYASINAYVQTSGGSYDDASSFSLGSKSVTFGEQYVNIREVIQQFRTRIDEILDAVGRRFNITVL